MFCKKGFPWNFAKFTGKHLCQSLSATTEVFSCEFCENLRTLFFYRTSLVAPSDYNQSFIDFWYNWQYADWSASFFIYSTTLFKYRFNLRIFKNVSWSYEQYNSKGITILHYNFSRKIILLVRFRTIKGINLHQNVWISNFIEFLNVIYFIIIFEYFLFHDPQYCLIVID